MTLRKNTKTTLSWLPASLSLFVSGPSCAHHTHVFVAFRSDMMEHTASLAESQPAVKCVTTPSTTWSRGRWFPPMYRHCWNQIRCAVTMARAQMAWPYVLALAKGRCLVWDFTCPDTLAASHHNRVVLGSGVVANDAESRRSTKYSSLSALLSNHSNCDWDIGCAGRRSAVILPWPWSAHCSCHSWTTFISAPDATSECCNTTWQCSLHHRNCALFCWLGRTFLHLV